MIDVVLRRRLAAPPPISAVANIIHRILAATEMLRPLVQRLYSAARPQVFAPSSLVEPQQEVRRHGDYECQFAAHGGIDCQR